MLFDENAGDVLGAVGGIPSASRRAVMEAAVRMCRRSLGPTAAREPP
jgi:hypothetical protein